ncbi:MAG TPA: hypothetical protein VMT81_02920 [Candidatus Paceibacterota bacterium]|nr:hypothetical protein [Candidatus Paceibacterota bacterium]
MEKPFALKTVAILSVVLGFGILAEAVLTFIVFFLPIFADAGNVVGYYFVLLIGGIAEILVSACLIGGGVGLMKTQNLARYSAGIGWVGAAVLGIVIFAGAAERVGYTGASPTGSFLAIFSIIIVTVAICYYLWFGSTVRALFAGKS